MSVQRLSIVHSLHVQTVYFRRRRQPSVTSSSHAEVTERLGPSSDHLSSLDSPSGTQLSATTWHPLQEARLREVTPSAPARPQGTMALRCGTLLPASWMDYPSRVY